MVVDTSDLLALLLTSRQRKASARSSRRIRRGSSQPPHLFAYALARTSGEPLPFKGGDFSKTDVGRVL